MNMYRVKAIYPSVLDSDQVEELKQVYKETYPESIESVDSCITKYKVYTLRDHHGKSIKFGFQQSEHANSVHISSYVHLKTSRTMAYM